MAESREVDLLHNNDAFCLMGTHDSQFALKITSASLFVKKVTVSTAVRLGHAAALMKGNALYPLSCMSLKTYSIPENSRICNRPVPAKAFQPQFDCGNSVREFYHVFSHRETPQRFTSEHRSSGF